MGCVPTASGWAMCCREDETEVPAYLQEAFAKTSRFQEIVSQEHITGRTGNEILKTCLERAQQEGIAAMLYCHPIGYFGHSAGTVVGLWDMQQGIGEYGDFPLHKNTCYALELNTESCLKEWGGQRVRFSAEETSSLYRGWKAELSVPGQRKNLRNLKQNR